MCWEKRLLGSALMPEPGQKLTKEEQREIKMQQVRAGRVQWLRELLKQGKEENADRYAGTYSLQEDLAQLRTERANKAALEMAEDYAATRAETQRRLERLQAQTVAAPVPDVLEQGWPKTATAEVSRYPVNKRMSVVTLPDGREARLWNDGVRRWALGSKVAIRIEEWAGGEPIYVAVS